MKNAIELGRASARNRERERGEGIQRERKAHKKYATLKSHHLRFIEMRILFHFKYKFVTETSTLANEHIHTHTQSRLVIRFANRDTTNSSLDLKSSRGFCVCLGCSSMCVCAPPKLYAPFMKTRSAQYSAYINNGFSRSNPPQPRNNMGVRCTMEYGYVLRGVCIIRAQIAFSSHTCVL